MDAVTSTLLLPPAGNEQPSRLPWNANMLEWGTWLASTS